MVSVNPSSIKQYLDEQMAAPSDTCETALTVLPSMIARNVDEYMTVYGGALGSEARRRLRPLHDPSFDAPSRVLLKRAPFPAQAHVAIAAAKCLVRKTACCIVGEMGTGKTFISLNSILEHMNQMGIAYEGFRAIIMCPGHLVSKWAREITDTVPEARVVVLKKWSDIINIHAKLKYKRPSIKMFYVISRDTAKLGPGWHPVYKMGPRDVGPKCNCCGQELLTKDGQPVDLVKLEKNKMFCENKILNGDGSVGNCGNHLWAYDDDRVRKWMPADYIKKQMKGFFNYLIIDEAHEEKSATSEQAIAAGALIAATKYQLILTGTLIGGYAEDIRPMLFRLCGRKMRERGYSWGGSTQFIRDYGRIDTIITETEGGEASKTGRGKASSKREQPKPGIMPTLFGDMLMDWTVFISLNEISENLPSFTEKVIPVELDGLIRDDEGQITGAVPGSQAHGYKRMEKALAETVKLMLARQDRRLLATMLQSLLAYPDHPFKWNMIGYKDKPKPGVDLKVLAEQQKFVADEGEDHVGDDEDNVEVMSSKKPKKRRKSIIAQGLGSFVPVVQPDNLDEESLYPKERALIDLIRSEKKAGRQVWVYVQNTSKRDVLARLHKVLTASGLNGKVLRSNTVKPIDREEWIFKNGRGQDFIVSHPQLVQTGMDLFDKGGNHNFVTLIFYQTGYQTVTLRQASRRSWRIGQNKPCFVYYLFYAGTMQSQAMELMGNKIKASMQVEGKFSAEGLAQMCDDTTGIEMALAKKLASLEDANDSDAIRAWERIGGTENEHSFREDVIEAESEVEESEIDVTGVSEEQATNEINDLLASLIKKFGDFDAGNN